MPLLADLDIYVAPTGNDANPGTPAQPVLTMTGAWDKVRDTNGNLTYLLGAAVRVHIAAFPAGLQYVPVPGYQAISDAGQVIIYGDGALQPGENGFVSPAQLTVPAAGPLTTQVSVDPGASGPLVPDAYIGMTLRFTTGAAAGEMRTVRSNTATEIVPCAAFTNVPLPGDAFEVLMPATRFE
jgi:hypothetical protein